MKDHWLFILIALLLVGLSGCKENVPTNPDTTSPTVQITYPGNNQSFASGAVVSITVSAEDSKVMEKVTFLIDGDEVNTDSVEPYTYDWDTSGLSGNHTIQVKAMDAAENVSLSTVVNVDILALEGMVYIPAGNSTFQMGSDAGFENELPMHAVTLTHDIWMSETEITQADYNALMSASYAGYFTPSWNSTYGAGANYPVYEVSWSDAVLYCNARSRAEGLDSVYVYTGITGTPGSLSELVGVSADLTKNGYRLPTEAEWEFACRGGVMQDYYWGADFDPYPATAADSLEFNNNAVWYGNAWIMDVDLGYGTHPVKTKQANAYGLYDMAGNVYEWCHDWYGDYSSSAQTDPAGPSSGDYHTLRGGSWANEATYLRATNRTFFAPCYYYYLLGFRVVRTITG